MSKNLSNKSILTELYQNAHTAMQSIKNLSPEVEDASVKCELISEYNRYQKIIDEINTLMDKYQVEKKDIGVFRKVSMAAAIKMKTFFSAKKKKVADMMIKGQNANNIKFQDTMIKDSFEEWNASTNCL